MLGLLACSCAGIGPTTPARVTTTIRFDSNVPGAYILSPSGKIVTQCPGSVKVNWKGGAWTGVQPWMVHGDEMLEFKKGVYRVNGIVTADNYVARRFSEAISTSQSNEYLNLYLEKPSQVGYSSPSQDQGGTHHVILENKESDLDKAIKTEQAIVGGIGLLQLLGSGAR